MRSRGVSVMKICRCLGEARAASLCWLLVAAGHGVGDKGCWQGQGATSPSEMPSHRVTGMRDLDCEPPPALLRFGACRL